MQREAKNFLKGKKVLVMGLGLHGGGVATVKWLLRHGATVTATDMRDEGALASSLNALKGKSVRYVLGRHDEADFRSHDIIVVNPGVPRESAHLAVAQKAGKRIENVASLFFSNTHNPVIGVTGTRGKTTTTLFIASLLAKKYRGVLPSGNPENALLDEFERIEGKPIPAVAELSSWQLEYLPQSGKAPHISIITNLFRDHQNRYGGMEDYARAKANIFASQTADDSLILNHDNKWIKFFLKQKPHAQLFFISMKPLPKTLNGAFIREGKLIFCFSGIEETLFSIKKFLAVRGKHNLENLLFAVLAGKLFDPSIKITESDILKLPTPHMRQEIIVERNNLMVINDSCATSPDGTIAALERFAPLGNVILIAGGTDKDLEFKELAKNIKKHIPSERLILLEGSATDKLVQELKNIHIPHSKFHIQKTLESCVHLAFLLAKKTRGRSIILFSPGAASFEKFLHEFDRGEQFNALTKMKQR